MFLSNNKCWMATLGQQAFLCLCVRMGVWGCVCSATLWESTIVYYLVGHRFWLSVTGQSQWELWHAFGWFCFFYFNEENYLNSQKSWKLFVLVITSRVTLYQVQAISLNTETDKYINKAKVTWGIHINIQRKVHLWNAEMHSYAQNRRKKKKGKAFFFSVTHIEGHAYKYMYGSIKLE